MAGSITDFLENELLDHVLKNLAYTSPTTVYLALFTADPGEASGGTEVSGGSYARQAIEFDAGASRATANTNAETFPVATANWGTITHWVIFDALTGGNRLAHGDFTTSITINTDDQYQVSAGDIDISMVANGATTYLADKLLDHVFKNTTYTPAATVYLALFTSATGDDGSGTEVSGGSYAREAMEFDAAVSGATDNTNDETFTTATANWGTITYNAIMDA